MNENKYNQYCNGCKLIFDHYGEENQLNKLVEECSELIRAISRKNKVNILEEVADVQVLIDQFTIKYPKFDNSIKLLKVNKVERQIKRIKECQ